MGRALELAARGRRTTRPNPMVGAVLVREGAKVGEGWHARAGEPHAEIEALTDAGEAVRGATIYVTLEPCCFTGRTGPCTDALIEAGVPIRAIEQGVAQSSGLSADKVGQLLPMLAPLVMGALGKAKQQNNLDAGGLASMLNQERARVEHDTPGMQDGGLLGFLDMDNDGDVTDDVVKIGGMLSSFLGK